jgi:hypothetical protein
MTPSAASAASASPNRRPTHAAERTTVTTNGSPPQDIDSLPLLLAVPRAATILGISRASAYRLAASGELPVRHLGGRVYVVTKLLRQLVEGDDEAAA